MLCWYQVISGTWTYLYTWYLGGYTVCTVFFLMGGLIHQGQHHDGACVTRIVWCICFFCGILRCATLTAVEMSFFRARWSIYWGKSEPLRAGAGKRTPWGSRSPRTPCVGYMVGARAPHEFLRIVYTAGQSTRHQAWNWKAGPVWISYSRIGSFYAKSAFLVAHFLHNCQCTTIRD